MIIFKFTLEPGFTNKINTFQKTKPKDNEESMWFDNNIIT